MTLPQKNDSRIKTPSSKSLILVSFCWKINVLFINTLTNLIWSLISLKLVIVGVAFFLGHPVYVMRKGEPVRLYTHMINTIFKTFNSFRYKFRF